MIPPNLSGAVDGWHFSFDCPMHGLVHGEFLRLESDEEGRLFAVCQCEDGLEECYLALAPHPEHEQRDVRLTSPVLRTSCVADISYGIGGVDMTDTP